MLAGGSNFRWGRCEPEVRAYLALAGNGIQPPAARALNRFVKSGKQSGWWPKLAEVYPFCGASLAAALVKLKAAPGSPGSLTNNGFGSGDYSQTVGFGQSGTSAKYLQTGISLDSLGLSNTNFSIGGWVTATDQNGPGYYLSDNPASGACQLFLGPTGAGAGTLNFSFSASGLHARVYSSDATHAFNMQAGVLTDRSVATPVSSFTTSNEIVLGRRTHNGGGLYQPMKLGMTFVGSALTEADSKSVSRAVFDFDRAVRIGVTNVSAGRWAFPGDSIVKGQYASTAAQQWTNIVAATRSKAEINFGAPNSATTFETGAGGGWVVSLLNRFQDVLAQDFEKVFVCYGANDTGLDGTTNGDATKIAAYQAGLSTVLTAFAARYGAANVFAISPQWRADKNATFCGAWNAAMAAAASAAGVTFVDYYTVYAAQADPSLLRQDNVHPNNAGHALMASTVLGFL